ncbi:MAG: hypothetical protein ACRET9_05005, partial [Burkholderiales bacterium]
SPRRTETGRRMDQSPGCWSKVERAKAKRCPPIIEPGTPDKPVRLIVPFRACSKRLKTQSKKRRILRKALTHGMEENAAEFRQAGAEVYRKP